MSANGLIILIGVVIAVLLAVLIVAAIISYKNDSWTGIGTIVGKEHKVAHNRSTVNPVIGGSGGVTLGSEYVPPSWHICIRDSGGEDHWIPTNEQYFSACSVGQPFNNEPGK